MNVSNLTICLIPLLGTFYCTGHRTLLDKTELSWISESFFLDSLNLSIGDFFISLKTTSLLFFRSAQSWHIISDLLEKVLLQSSMKMLARHWDEDGNILIMMWLSWKFYLRWWELICSEDGYGNKVWLRIDWHCYLKIFWLIFKSPL